MLIETKTFETKDFASSAIHIDFTGGSIKRNVLILTERQRYEKAPLLSVISKAQSDTFINIVKHLKDFEDIKIPATLYFYDVADNFIDDYSIRSINRLIKKYDINMILCAGINTAAHLLSLTPFRASQLRGRILPCEKLNCPIVPTFAVRMAISENPKDWKDLTPNLIGFVKDDLATCIRGKNLYTINTDIDYKIIKTIDAWKKLFKTLIMRKPEIAIDIESKNLNKRFDNNIYTIQFAFDDSIAYIVPLNHSRTPFLPHEIRIIYADIKHFLETRDDSCVLTQNGKFDLSVLFTFLGCDFIAPKIWDISVGEYFLDENRKYMWGLRVSLYGLDQKAKYKSVSGYSLETLVAQYSGKFPYDDSTIGKDDRLNLNNYSLKKIAPYCSRDVIYLFRIKECQIKEAQRRGGFYNKYIINVTELGASMMHIFVEIETSGINMDRKYLNDSILYDSPSGKQLREMELQIYAMPSTIKANKLLLKEEANQGISTSLFSKVPWVFNINKQHHQQVLFKDVLKLNGLNIRKNGDMSIDDEFLKTFADHEEVLAFSELRKLQKLFTTYLTGLGNILKTRPDCKDGRLTANYDFISVVTVRTSCSDPGLQQIPSHGVTAKVIKKAFIANWLGILLKVDYNAHEVRIWGNLARDKMIAKAFKVGMKIRRELRIWQSKNFDLAYECYEHLDKISWKKLKIEEKKAIISKLKPKYQYLAKLLVELEENGDVHKKNYEFFFGVPAAKVTPEQRQSVKNTVFGSMYGKVGSTLGEDLNIKEVRKLRLQNPDATYLEMRELLKPYHDIGQNLIDKMFGTFQKGHAWILYKQKEAKTFYRTASPIGPVRHLWGYFMPHKTLTNRMDRLASNSINQGLASNLGYIGARQFQILKFMAKKAGVLLNTKIVNSVHDSLENEITLITSLPFSMYYLEHSLMTRTAKVSKEVYGFELMIGLEAEFEVGFSADDLTKYAFTEYSFMKIVDHWITRQEDHFNRTIPKKQNLLNYMKAAYRFVEKHRGEELETVDSYEPEKHITLTLEKAKAFNDNNEDLRKFINAIKKYA
jgi:DNA polymerase I-like protein with 3'-5' exonuclease and polymerase domains